ncbi:aminoglycoside adenylyltransferase domain-containing protein [Oceanobacillus indicireducens]|uniref:Spectinomycin 9-adenylyltransferase n=1 Tax=Oceanobacillus indicireducens TaxID=1004261 RepID=A0A917XZI7_9BACI|nr:aminoglycoside adenylyltransferase domain-containing protein [Oceanobacillus indicireducens]GGN59190.1 adenylyltransferase [Oceanobacillus indicireducens]
MSDGWKSCPTEIKDFILQMKERIKEIIDDKFIGFYLHGSLAMGGFNPNRSDIDVLVVTDKPIRLVEKRNLARLFLGYSSSPYPIEVSFLSKKQLMDWQHPCPFEFHFSDYWRERYETDLFQGTYQYINEVIQTDPDLAAHITITNYRGICIEGKPVDEVFPKVPLDDYLSSIMGDYLECLENIAEDPIYCSLNMLRVFWFLDEGVISSKKEAGDWGQKNLPLKLRNTVRKATENYADGKDGCSFEKLELLLLRDYIAGKVQELL